MNVQYNQKVNALYLRFSDQVPDGVIKMAKGVNLDTTAEGKITGIEILGSDLINKVAQLFILCYLPEKR